MTEILTSEQMRALERAAIDSGSVSGRELMERAGLGVVEAILAEWPELAEGGRSAEILCGPGNNGGDGFVVARLLKQRGWQVRVAFYGDAERLPPDARHNYDLWSELGDVVPACREGWTDDLRPVDLIVDAVFGIGLSRPVDDPCLWEWFWLVDDALDTAPLDRNSGRWTRSVAIDIPSGLDADTGEVIGGEPEHGLRAPRVMLTVTFHASKRGHIMGEGPDLCSKLVVKGIGL